MLKEIQRETRMDKNKIQRITEFLKEYNFIAVDEARKKVKLDKIVQKFLTQTATS